MGGEISVFVDCYGVFYTLFLKELVLQAEDGFIQIDVIFGVKFGRGKIPDGDIVCILDIIQGKEAVVYGFIKDFADHFSAHQGLDLSVPE